MICQECAWEADDDVEDLALRGKTMPRALEHGHAACPGPDRCDCQHREVQGWTMSNTSQSS